MAPTRILNGLRQFPLYVLALSVCVSVSGGGLGAGLVVLLAAGMLLVRPRECSWPPRPVLLSLAALLGVNLLATALAAPYPHNWFKLGEEMWIKLLLIAVPVVVGGDRELALRILRLTLGMGCLAAAYAVVQYFLGVDPIRHRSIFRPDFGHVAVSGFFGHHLSYAGQILVVFLLVAAWARHQARGRRLGPTAGVLLILVLAVAWNFSRSLWLGVMAGALVLGLLAGWRRGTPRLAGATLTVMVALLALPPVRRHFLSIFALDQHLTRLNLWRSAWAGMVDNPLLGLGPGNFGLLLERYQVPGHYNTLAHAHNDWLMHGVNAGFPGVVAAVALLVVLWRVVWRARLDNRAPRWVLDGALAVLVGMAVAGFFQVFQTDDEVELLLYFILGLVLALVTAPRATRPAV